MELIFCFFKLKDFAETAMNELLGWYGYDSVEITKNKMQQNRPNGSRERSSSPSFDSSRENSTSPQLPIITTEKRGKYNYKLFFLFSCLI